MSKAATKQKYPEHEKLKAHQRDVGLLSEFYDFLTQEQGWEIAKFDDDSQRLWPIRERPAEIIGLFIGVDPKKLEKEKQAMLAEIRSTQPRKDGEG